jgi:hypothetical protein
MRSWAVTKRAGRDTLGRVYDEKDPGLAGDPTIPDYVMRDFESIERRSEAYLSTVQYRAGGVA